MNKRILMLPLAALCLVAAAFAALPGQTLYSADQCRGSRMPYVAPDSTAAWPDSLTPVMINHVGRHGARFPTSAKHFTRLAEALESAPGLTDRGREMLALTRRAIESAEGRWGELDSLGVSEQRGLGERMFTAFPQLFIGHQVDAVSSYVPRCVASMDAFTGRINELSGGLCQICADSGEEYSPLLRPFTTDSLYLEFTRSKPYQYELEAFTHSEQPIEVAYMMAGQQLTPEQAEEITADVYYVVSSLAAMGMEADAMRLFSLEEYNRMWQVDNLRQYLTRTASTISTVPAEIASDLVRDLIETTDDFIAGSDSATVYLRFGHAETIMPLASLLRLPGCYYLTHYFDTVALHWQSWNVVPMASNVRQILFRSHTGRYYLRTELNERPVTLIPGCDDLYVPWERARYYMEVVSEQ